LFVLFVAVGSCAGPLLASRRGRPRTLVLALAAMSFAVAEIVAGLMPTYWLFAAWLPVVGVTALTMLTSLQTVVQLNVAAEMRGRVVALYMMTLMGGTPFGAPVIGWVGETFGPRWTLLGGGLATLVVVTGATVWLMRRTDVSTSELSVPPATVAA
ncbi:MAG: MFS transporter, partial [Nocardioidaceae bacterium]